MLPYLSIKYLEYLWEKLPLDGVKCLENILSEMEFNYPFVSLTPMTSISSMIYKIKKDCTIYSNNYNHPNNFLHRVYAREILNTLIGNYYSEVK